MTGWLWAVFAVLAAAGQTLRNAMQKDLTERVGTVGATHVRFLFGLPFAALFLAIILIVTREPIPAITPHMLGWCAIGGAAQILATGLMLAAMRQKSFVVITALYKIEPVHVALFGLAFLGDRLTAPLIAAIAIATLGVLALSWPKTGAKEVLGAKAVSLGLLSGAMFAIAAVGYRGGILALQGPNFVVNATTTVVIGLLMQVAYLTVYLVLFDRPTLIAIFQAWRQSMVAGFMGALASEMWFLAFALESAAKVRTLGLVEIFFAGILSRKIFEQNLVSRDGFGMLLIVIGVVLLLNQ